MIQPAETLLDADAVARIIRRMASEMIERMRGCGRLGLVGIQRGGTPIATRLAHEIKVAENLQVPIGALDITLYRDDAAIALPDPKVGPSRIEWPVEDADVVLVDDVLHTGRTVRAAIDCLLDYGRPRRIWLAVLCDRGGRQLPIAADFVGRSVEIPDGFVLDVVAEGGSHDGARLRPTPVKGKP
ncbi:MAG TPA: bifunctional pyr operon transcriptional regulator/uracil phosphoribosyltransferase PyrR [Polyangiales bacterium]